MMMIAQGIKSDPDKKKGAQRSRAAIKMIQIKGRILCTKQKPSKQQQTKILL